MILFFSATGNSERVAEVIAEKTGDNVEPIVDAFKNGQTTMNLAPGERLGIVSPVYFWRLPSITEEFLRRVSIRTPEGTEPYVYGVITFGTTTGRAGSDMRRLLRNRGICLDASFSVQMPDTWTPMFDLSDADKVAGRVEHGEQEAAAVATNVLARERGCHTHRRIPVPAVLTDVAYDRMRRCDNLSVREDACTSCGLCVRRCPCQAIEMQGKRPVWVKERCCMCLGCLHRCPVHAIRYGTGRATDRHGRYRNPHTRM